VHACCRCCGTSRSWASTTASDVRGVAAKGRLFTVLIGYLMAMYADIEMGRTVTKAADPVVLYVSGGNTQVIAYSMQW